MSVWKKAAKANQKTHRERHQPEARQHLGLLEKKKDYVKRAKDRNEKDETLKVLRKRALNRNPEEFYHHMINSKVSKDGVHHEKDKDLEHTKEQLQLMETQDVRYVNMKRTQEMKRIERLQSQMHLIDIANKPNNSHKYIFPSKEELKQFQTKQADSVNSKLANYSLDKLSEKPLTDIDVEHLVKMRRKRENTYRELAARIRREKELSVVQQKLEIKRHLQTKKGCFPPKRVCDASKNSPAVYKWKTQRKR